MPRLASRLPQMTSGKFIHHGRPGDVALALATWLNLGRCKGRTEGIVGLSVECVVASRSRLGEGPGGMRATSACGGSISAPGSCIASTRHAVTTRLTRLASRLQPGPPRGRRPGHRTESGLYLFDPESGAKSCIAQPEADLPGNRFNDGGTDPRGRFWAGTMKDDGGRARPRQVLPAGP